MKAAELSPVRETALAHVPAPAIETRAMPLTRLAGFDPDTVKPKNMLFFFYDLWCFEICTVLLNAA